MDGFVTQLAESGLRLESKHRLDVLLLEVRVVDGRCGGKSRLARLEEALQPKGGVDATGT